MLKPLLIVVIGLAVVTAAVFVGGKYLGKEAADETADWKTYRNEEDGVEIRIPLVWNNYRVTDNCPFDYGSYLCFSFGSFCVMQVLFQTPEQFQNKVEQYPELSSYDYRNENYYYTFEYLPGCGQLNEFECARTKEVPKISKTFQFIK